MIDLPTENFKKIVFYADVICDVNIFPGFGK